MNETKKNVAAKKPATKKPTAKKPDKKKWNESLGGKFVDVNQIEFVNKPK